MFLRRFLAVFFLLLSSSPAAAGEPDSRVSASTRMVLRAVDRGVALPLPGRLNPGEMRMLSASIRFEALPSQRVLADLEELGVEFYRAGGEMLHVGAIYPARIPMEAVGGIAGRDDVQRLETSLSSRTPELVDNYPQMTEAAQTWPALDQEGVPTTGAGVTAGAIDSWIDIFHPSFFRADGGYFDWIDVDDDGEFDPGVDAVDWERDGEASSKEVLELVKGTVAWHNDMGGPEKENDGDNFVTDLDWLWMDHNGNGKREWGIGPGFSEDNPTYGEPYFVADDINGSGTLDPGEKLVGLKTCKVRAIYLPHLDEVYRRGENLIEYPRVETSSSHATMTVGVLAGNNRGFQRFHGVAPDADILVADMEQGAQTQTEDTGGLPYIAGLAWLVAEGAQVVMHEYGSPFMEFGDGTSNMEAAIDLASQDDSVTSCTATHNYAGYNMHATAEVPAGGTLDFPFELGIYGDQYPPYMLMLNLRWREPGAPLSLTLVDPAGAQVILEDLEREGDLGADHHLWYTGVEISPRETHMANFLVYSSSYYSPLTGGDWLLRVENLSDEPQAVDLFAADHTGYMYTGNLTEHADKSGTISHPATADSAISVGAYRSNVDSWYGQFELGDLSFYSGRGPRIDGELGLDVAAPSDAIAAWFDPEWDFYPAFSYAAGTSGSLPQVTGMVALLLQTDPDLSPEEAKKRVVEGALKDKFVGEPPNNDWGWGKASAYRTIFGVEPSDNVAPEALLEAPAQVFLQESFTLDAGGSVDDGPEGELEVRWDLGYDGQWDTEFSTNLELPVAGIEQPGEYLVVVQVRDAGGFTDRALAHIQVLDEVFVPEPEVVEMVEEKVDILVQADATSFVPDTDAAEVGPEGEETTVRRGSKGCAATPSPAGGGLPLLAGLLLSLVGWLVSIRRLCGR